MKPGLLVHPLATAALSRGFPGLDEPRHGRVQFGGVVAPQPRPNRALDNLVLAEDGNSDGHWLLLLNK